MALAELLNHPAYPLPSQPVCWTAKVSDGVQLRFARWKPMARAGNKGTVLLVNGRAEFIERYSEIINGLRKRGFHVITFDWRGQGGSDRLTKATRKGHVGRLAHYRRDLDCACQEMQASMPGPYFALAHSMGGAMCLDAAIRDALPVERLVTVAPMLGLSMVEHPNLVRLLAKVLYWIGLGSSYVPGGGETAIATMPFANNRLTTDPVRYARNAELSAAAPHLAIGAPTVGWVRAAYHLMDKLAHREAAMKVNVPTLILAGRDDPIVSTPDIERFATKLKTGPAIVIAGARHEILMETDAILAQFWAAFDAFVPGEGHRTETPEADSSSAQKRQRLVVQTRVS
ncbi:MAG: alpha/beta fold hydrolase [Bosea sp. (in: a-proteobacteria)]